MQDFNKYCTTTSHQSVNSHIRWSQHQMLITRVLTEASTLFRFSSGSVRCCLGNRRREATSSSTNQSPLPSRLIITPSTHAVKGVSLWMKTPLSADLWARGSGKWASQRPHIHGANMKRHKKPGHVENLHHGVKKTISYNLTDGYE